MQPSKQIVLVAIQALGLVACTTTNAIGPGQLARLDGYDAQRADSDRRQVETVDGQQKTFNRDTNLTIDAPPNVSAGGRFASIHVQDDVFSGRTLDGREVQVRVSQVQAAKIEQPDNTRNHIFAGVLLAAVVLGTVAVLFSMQSSQQSIPGRPLRVKGAVVTAPLGRSRGWMDDLQPALTDLSPPARAALATYWHETALFEHASVPAFSRLSMTLMALGAPSRLVEAALRAARDEIGHARIAFSMASAYAGSVVAPGPLSELAIAPAITATSLRALAVESLIDGCLMEGFSAAVIEAGGARAADRSIRSALATIAREEASHAQLAWDIVGWCIEQDGQIGADLLPLVERAPPPAAPYEFAAALEAEVGDHGLITASEWRRLFSEARAQVAEGLRGPMRKGMSCSDHIN